MRALLPLLCAAAGFVPAAAQDVPAPAPPVAVHATPTDSTTTRLYTPAGDPLAFSDLLTRLDTTDVLFLGEQHDDAVGHAFQRLLFDAVVDRYAGRRPVVLALEMFERDVQLVLDEYLAGVIREKDFLAAARPWSNYTADYRPLVEAARANGLPVVASNAPARYVSRAGRGASLDSLSATARAYLPALPAEPASPAVREAFYAVMESMGALHPAMPASAPDSLAESDSVSFHHAMPAMDIGAMLAAQNLRDASMGETVNAALGQAPGALVVHVNGSFHTEGRTGIVDHLLRVRPAARVLVLTAEPVADARAFDAATHGPLGDVIALTGQPTPATDAPDVTGSDAP